MKDKRVKNNTFLKAFLCKIDLSGLFISIVGASAAVYFLLSAIIGNGSFADIFFLRGGDFFMDFFNSVRDASQLSGVYTERKVIYPPMANLIFLLLSRFTPADYNATDFISRYDWIKYFSPLMLLTICALLCGVALFFAVYRSITCGTEPVRALFAFLALFSAPILYLIERGNILILCLLSLLIYAATYNSKSALAREVGIIALAFAFSIKLYPAIFGWCLVADGRTRDAVRCAIYGGLMLLIPSFFFGGPICFWWMIQNIFSFSTEGTGSTITIICSRLGLSQEISLAANLVSYAWFGICALCFAVTPFIFKEKSRFYFAGASAILCIPSLTSLYAWTFMLIPIILSCNKPCREKSDLIQNILAIIPFAHIPFRLSYHVTLATVVLYICTAALSVCTVIITLSQLKKRLRTYLRKRYS